MIKFIKASFQIINVIVIVALLVIHFILKESSYQTSLFYYTFPLPIIIIIILLFSIFLSKKMRKYNFVIAGLLLIFWLGRSFKINTSEDIEETNLEVVFWNASHDRGFEESFKVNKGIPDVLVLVEMNENDVESLQKKYPNYYFYKSLREIGVFSKLPLNTIKEKSSKYNTTLIMFETFGVRFCAVDVSASMDVPRTWELGFVNSLIKNKENTIILGDFNVPYESVLLEDIKQDFNHAFSEKGNGFRETWFWNLPLLSLDHIWVSKDLKVLKTQKISTFKSDHSMIKTFIRK